MTTLDQLKEVSLHHFALHGYEGASLAHIAKDVGIKKQSIYTYFAGKDDLFLQIFEDACKFEISMVMEDLVLTKG
ncbi:transcriptional regulator, TetR family [Anoxybacillus pushchinoensis]|jgi:AcrR family transcriptional regulator|uniref:Transcriptional regulator, TetR family n=1 Tax=Anoxybacillus pushchinoensis TaxID=150248 RepID=A0A1I0TG02_9BACL|nr:TetR/AcrR family transcriptional regulator [Anoxybacillus pushchinoensis]SFA50694.1 transcriptional regulator, TetR family [Anoxybacillus pushchinoensis]